MLAVWRTPQPGFDVSIPKTKNKRGELHDNLSVVVRANVRTVDTAPSEQTDQSTNSCSGTPIDDVLSSNRPIPQIPPPSSKEESASLVMMGMVLRLAGSSFNFTALLLLPPVLAVNLIAAVVPMSGASALDVFGASVGGGTRVCDLGRMGSDLCRCIEVGPRWQSKLRLVVTEAIRVTNLTLPCVRL